MAGRVVGQIGPGGLVSVITPSMRGALNRIEAHLWACTDCGSEPSVRGTLDAPVMVCPLHPEAELRKKAR